MEEILANHSGNSSWQGKNLANKLQSVHMPNTFLVYL